MLRHFIPRNDDRVFAFTLAEVLITLVIIGVIAALTIPNLLQKYQEQATVKKVQKFYSNLSNAYNLAMKDNGTTDEWGLTGSNQDSHTKIYEKLFKPYFKISKDCGFSSQGNCFSAATYLDNTSAGNPNTNSNYYKIVLDDGSAVTWYAYVSTAEKSVVVIYDSNGKKGPNQWGKDYFSMYIRNDRHSPIPYGLPSNAGKLTAYNFDTYCKKDAPSLPGWGCAAWVIYKGNMDYLHCNDLSWNGKDKCK